ncbi:VWA domain-containing protein [Myxococcota bacterium]|nr:VWA domain-containing protein [Myxococcota bacterium]MBU1431126.1 VWA domain-containing protein [Myxococcota bacterium]MBU1899561.1 VWA domain-containing protein [Myxococcota bacterium]
MMPPRALPLALLALTALIGCGPVGGDTEPGVSACPALAGEGAWRAPTSSAVGDDSGGPVKALEVLSGLSVDFKPTGGHLTLSVKLEDKDGALLFQGLKADDFQLDGDLLIQPQNALAAQPKPADRVQVTDVSSSEPRGEGVSVALVFDSSGSTSGTDPDRRRVDAAKAFVEDLHAGAMVAVLDFGVAEGLFDEQVSDCFEACRFLLDFTADIGEIEAAIDRVTAAGGTPLYAAMKDSMDLVDGARKQGAKSVDVVVFTDGQAGDYDKAKADKIISRAKKAGTRLHTVALSTVNSHEDDQAKVDLRNLQRLSAETNGLSLTSKEADTLISQFKQAARATNASVMVSVVLEARLNQGLSPGLYVAMGTLKSTANRGSATAPFSFTFEIAD